MCFKLQNYYKAGSLLFSMGSRMVCPQSSYTYHGVYIFLAAVSITTRQDLAGRIEQVSLDTTDTMVKQIRQFLAGNQPLYQFGYDQLNDPEYPDLPVRIQINSVGQNTTSLEIWHPAAFINLDIIKECVSNFCARYLGIRVDSITYKEIVSREQALSYYQNDPLLSCKEPVNIDLSAEVLDQLCRTWKKSRAEVLAIIHAGINQKPPNKSN